MGTPVSFDLAAAVSHNRFWGSRRRRIKRGAKRLIWQGQGWAPLYGAISAWIFDEYDPMPTPQAFAYHVAQWQREREGLSVNGVLSRTPWRRMQEEAARGIPSWFASPINGLVRPHGWDQILTTFGDPRTGSRTEWETTQIRAARAPGSRRFTFVDGRQSPVLYLHRTLVPHAEAFLLAVARGGLWDELQPLGSGYEWDPACRSLHTWGIALDFRPGQYPPGLRPRDYPDAEHYPPGYLMRHVKAYGWQWGLWFDTPHPGHIQFATGVEEC